MFRGVLKCIALVLAVFAFTACATQPKTVDQGSASNNGLGENPYLTNKVEVPPGAQEAFIEALQLLDSGNDALAEQKLIEVVEQYPTLSGPAYHLAVLYYSQNKSEESLAEALKAIERNQYNLDAYYLVAQIKRFSGEFVQAQEYYAQIIDIWRGYLPAYRASGVVYDLYQGLFEEALDRYKTYYELMPEKSDQVKGWITDLERRMGLELSYPDESIDDEYDDGYGDDEYGDDEYSDDEYSDDEYSDDYIDEEFSEDEITSDDYAD